MEKIKETCASNICSDQNQKKECIDKYSNNTENVTNSFPNNNLQESRASLARRILFFAKSRFTIGLIALGLVVILWSSDGFLINYILSDFSKPFFLTYFSISTLQLYFIGIIIRKFFAKRRLGNMQNNPPDTKDISSYPAAEIIDLKRTDTLMSATPTEHNNSPLRCLVPMTRKEIFRLSVYFFIVYFTANYFANASFEYTDVVSASILLSTSCFFTLVLCTIFRIEKFTLMKGLSVLICAAGVFILFFTTMDESAKDRLRGNLYALASAVLYGVYSVMAKKVIIDESRVDMPLFFGFVGLLSTISLWPLFIIFHYTGFETFELPSTGMSFGLLFVKNLIGTLLSNYCWLVALLYTTPLVVAIGISLCTPLTLIVDVIINKTDIIGYRALTGLFIIIGFLIVNFSELYPKFNYFWENLIFGKGDNNEDLPEPGIHKSIENNV